MYEMLEAFMIQQQHYSRQALTKMQGGPTRKYTRPPNPIDVLRTEIVEGMDTSRNNARYGEKLGKFFSSTPFDVTTARS